MVMVLSVRISLKMSCISDIPLKLDQPLNITVRECYLPRAEFERINIQRQENGEAELPTTQCSSRNPSPVDTKVERRASFGDFPYQEAN